MTHYTWLWSENIHNIQLNVVFIQNIEFSEILSAEYSMLLCVPENVQHSWHTRARHKIIIITISGHSVLICLVIVWMSVHRWVWTWVGRPKCELADTLGGWRTSIATTKLVQSIGVLVISAKGQTCLSAVFWPETDYFCLLPQGCLTSSQRSQWKPAAASCSIT